MNPSGTYAPKADELRVVARGWVEKALAEARRRRGERLKTFIVVPAVIVC